MTDIRPLLVSYWDTIGGAARAAYRLHKGLQQKGVESTILAGLKLSGDPTVQDVWLYRSALRRKILLKLERLPRRFLFRQAPLTPWSTNLLPTLGAGVFNRSEHSLINLHWIGNGFVPISVVGQIRKPIVWTLHDMWPFTGGCHIADTCDRYLCQCGRCPQLASGKEEDLSRVLWRRKHHAWAAADMTVVGPSRWLTDCAHRSSLFNHCPVHVIPNSIDDTVFKPTAKLMARTRLGLPPEGPLMLYGAYDAVKDKNKGYPYLVQALEHLAGHDSFSNMRLAVFGADGPPEGDAPPVPSRFFGTITDDHQLALLYSAADVTVVPSIQEAFCNAAAEAMACGTPVVSFDTSGLKDIVEHRQTGYRARCYDPRDLAEGIRWVLSDPDRLAALGERARAKVQANFTMEQVAARYIELYQSILDRRARLSP